MPDVDAIVLAVGSSCTLSGLVIGVALARALGLRAFQSPTFKIIGVSGRDGARTHGATCMCVCEECADVCVCVCVCMCEGYMWQVQVHLKYYEC